MTSQMNMQMKEHFEQVYEKNKRSITLFLIAKCKNFSDVNDILQEVFVEYYQVLIKKGIQYIRDEEAFLISLCRKKIASYYSFWERIPYQFSLDEKENHEKDEVFYETHQDLEEDFWKAEMIEEVKRNLKNQPDDVQKIFYLYYTMELKVPEIAKLLHMKEQTVKNKLFRTRKAIRNQLMKDWR